MAKKLGEAYVELTTRGEGRMMRTVTSIKSRIMSAFGIMGAAGAVYGFTRFLKSSIQEALQAERIDKLLEARMGALGDTTGKAAKELRDYASTLQKLTGYDDENIKSAMTMLAMYGMQRDEIKKTIPRILDLAAAQENRYGVEADLQQIATQIGRAYTGYWSMLTRYGIIIDESARKGKDFNEVLKAIDKLAKGQAETLGKTYVGKIRALTAAWADFKQTIGMKVLPVITGLITELTELASFGKMKTPLETMALDTSRKARYERLAGEAAKARESAQTIRERLAGWRGKLLTGREKARFEYRAGVYEQYAAARERQMQRMRRAERAEAAGTYTTTQNAIAGYRAPSYGSRGLWQPIYKQQEIVPTLEQIEKILAKIEKKPAGTTLSEAPI